MVPPEEFPGFTRVSFPYFLDDATVAYIIESIKFIARHSRVLSTMYTYEDGRWVH